MLFATLIIIPYKFTFKRIKYFMEISLYIQEILLLPFDFFFLFCQTLTLTLAFVFLL